MSEALRRGVVLILSALALALVIVPSLASANTDENTSESAYCIRIYLAWNGTSINYCTGVCWHPAIWPNSGYFYGC